jgi:aminoglycoside phosphotransferase (APT) family kinase protein
VGHGGRVRAQLLEELELVTEWLVALHGSGAFPAEIWGETEVQRWVEAPLTAYAERFGLTGPESTLFGLARARAAALLGVAMPVAWEHYDLGPWNIYRDGDQLCVIDWENSTPKPPLADLLYFVTHWSARARGIRGEAAELRHFEELFCRRDHRDPYLAAARGAIATYTARLAVDERAYPVLLLRLWVLHAVGLAARGRIAGGPARASRAGNRFVQYVELLAASAERLMAETS